VTAPHSSGIPDPPAAPDDRLDSWKAIALYLKRDVTTVQRWEKRERMPVHRHLHDKAGSVYAFRRELDAWAAGRRGAPAARVDDPEQELDQTSRAAGPEALPSAARRILIPAAIGAVIFLAGAALLWLLAPGSRGARDVLTGARFAPLTNFGGSEHAATVSRDGRHFAFLSDRGGRMDVWVGQIGSGQFYNLTNGVATELVNPSVRNLGFSPDGALITFWSRRTTPTGESDIGIWAIPVLGGTPRPYLEGAAEFDWSADGGRLVYHTPGPGDPMFVRAASDEAGRQIFSAAPGLHAHFPVWSPDQRFIYFVQGALPDRMDIWRIPPAGGTAERITTHDASVSHPVFAGPRTLVYLASDADGGPWLYSIDVERREAHRVSSGVERYTSLAGTPDGRRLVATVSNPMSSLWRIPFGEHLDISSARPVGLTTVSGSSPRLGPNYLLYAASKGERDSIWKIQGDHAVEIWSAPGARVTGAPAVTRDGARIAFVTERDRQTSLFVANADGTDAREVTGAPRLFGAPAWSPDGRLITVGALVGGSPRLVNVPVDGGPPGRLVDGDAVDPVWSPDGRLLLYSGPDIGTTFEVKGLADGADSTSFGPMTMSRGSRHLVFTPDGRSLIALRGELGHKDLWAIDLDTRAERRLSRFPRDVIVRDFDLSPDGREIVLERVREHSDIVVIERSRR
jgi:Tol biopolymer transport system component